jgi:hypothetical protein
MLALGNSVGPGAVTANAFHVAIAHFERLIGLPPRGRDPGRAQRALPVQTCRRGLDGGRNLRRMGSGEAFNGKGGVSLCVRHLGRVGKSAARSAGIPLAHRGALGLFPLRIYDFLLGTCEGRSSGLRT